MAVVLIKIKSLINLITDCQRYIYFIEIKVDFIIKSCKNKRLNLRKRKIHNSEIQKTHNESILDARDNRGDLIVVQLSFLLYLPHL